MLNHEKRRQYKIEANRYIRYRNFLITLEFYLGGESQIALSKKYHLNKKSTSSIISKQITDILSSFSPQDKNYTFLTELHSMTYSEAHKAMRIQHNRDIFIAYCNRYSSIMELSIQVATDKLNQFVTSFSSSINEFLY